MSQCSTPVNSTSRRRKSPFKNEPQPPMKQQKKDTDEEFSVPDIAFKDRSDKYPIQLDDNKEVSGGINFTHFLLRDQNELILSMRPGYRDKPAAEFHSDELRVTLSAFDGLIATSFKMRNLYFSWIRCRNGVDADVFESFLYTYRSVSHYGVLSAGVDKLFTTNPDAAVAVRRLLAFYALYCMAPSCRRVYHYPHKNKTTDSKEHQDPCRVVLGCGHILCSGCAADNAVSEKRVDDIREWLLSDTSSAVVRCLLCSHQKRDVIAVESENTYRFECSKRGCAAHVSFFTPTFLLHKGERSPQPVPERLCLTCVYTTMKQRFVDDAAGCYNLSSNTTSFWNTVPQAWGGELLPSQWNHGTADSRVGIPFYPFYRNSVFHLPSSYRVQYEWEGPFSSAACVNASIVFLEALSSEQKEPLKKQEATVAKFISRNIWNRCSGFCRRSVLLFHPIYPAWVNASNECHHVFCEDCVGVFRFLSQIMITTAKRRSKEIDVRFHPERNSCLNCPRCDSSLNQLMKGDIEHCSVLSKFSAVIHPLLMFFADSRRHKVIATSLLLDVGSVFLERVYINNTFVYPLKMIPLIRTPSKRLTDAKPEDWWWNIVVSFYQRANEMIEKAIQTKTDMYHTQIACQEHCCRPVGCSGVDRCPIAALEAEMLEKEPLLEDLTCVVCTARFRSGVVAHHPYAFDKCHHLICRACIPKIVQSIDQNALSNYIVRSASSISTMTVPNAVCPYCRSEYTGFIKSGTTIDFIEKMERRAFTRAPQM